ncbi:hypothetical protein ABN028_31195 [Actinopolymorpha sp. B17G11]|uniref:AAA family ATPase n=1 Tax=unclassified Actinopolymorpha TaxID=2627063 RepID=UPI0032D97332
MWRSSTNANAASQSPPTQKASRFLLQMAGKSDAGKSTIAGPLARTSGAVTLDIDVLKSTALDIGLAWHDAGRIGYEGTWSLAESLLCQGISVIIDSPCRFERIVTEGMAISRAFSVNPRRAKGSLAGMATALVSGDGQVLPLAGWATAGSDTLKNRMR